MAGDDVIQRAARVITLNRLSGPIKTAQALHDAGLLAEPAALDKLAAEREVKRDNPYATPEYHQDRAIERPNDGIVWPTQPVHETWRLRGEFIDALARQDAFPAVARALVAHLDGRDG